MKKIIFLLSAFITTLMSNAQVTVTTLAGSGTFGFDDGTGAAAQFNAPTGVATDAAGNVYVADNYNHSIRKITTMGVVSTLAGSSSPGVTDGTGVLARFYYPSGLATDAAGNVYVADTYNNKIRKITPAGVVSTLAGSTYGFADGTGAAAQFKSPQAVATDASGNVYVADTANNKIRKITPAGVVSTLAGSTNGYADGTGAAAKLNGPRGVATDATGNLYVADYYNNKIRKISPVGVVSTLAGSTNGYADGTGAAAQLNYPIGVATDAADNVYVGDWGNNKIRKITPAGVVSTLAGSTRGFADGTAAVAQFNNPAGVATDAAGNVYVADVDNYKIRKITQQLGVAQNEVASKITISPNPAKETITIQTNQEALINNISIYNMLGQLMQVNTNPNETIDVSGLKTGSYFIKIVSDKGTASGKFLKE